MASSSISDRPVTELVSVPTRYRTPEEFEAHCRVIKILQDLITVETDIETFRAQIRRYRATVAELESRLEGDEVLKPWHREDIEGRRDEALAKARGREKLIKIYELRLRSYTAALGPETKD